MKAVLFVFACLSFYTGLAQEPEKIHFARDQQYIYFLQKGAASDSIIKYKSDLFYFLVPDSLRRYIVLQSENAQFSVAKKDSLLLCQYLPGMRYETFYQYHHDDLLLRSGVNGTSSVPKNKIVVQIVDKRTRKVLIENVFYVRKERD